MNFFFLGTGEGRNKFMLLCWFGKRVGIVSLKIEGKIRINFLTWASCCWPSRTLPRKCTQYPKLDQCISKNIYKLSNIPTHITQLLSLIFLLARPFTFEPPFCFQPFLSFTLNHKGARVLATKLRRMRRLRTRKVVSGEGCAL